MSKKTLELTERRNRLIKRATNQRIAIAQYLNVWRAPLELADHGISLFTHVRRQPILLAGISLLSVAFGMKRPRKWLKTSWMIWQTWRKFLAR
ncbi:MAG TPA: YqjK-like family protein [Burkholderiales bacterium]|nr:YqjK-like family protein [Burkholderiales bacterium]